jgi:hypothetical protein
MGLSFTIAAGPRQSSHFWDTVLRDLWPYFTVSDSRFPQSGAPSPRIYVPQEQGGQVMPPGTAFPFRRLLRLTGSRWRYSNPLPHEVNSLLTSCPAYITARTAQKRRSSVAVYGPLFSRLFRGRCLATGLHVTIFSSIPILGKVAYP